MKKTTQENKKIENLNLLLTQKEQEVRIAKQKAGFFARKHAEALAELGKVGNSSNKKVERRLNLNE